MRLKNGMLGLFFPSPPHQQRSQWGKRTSLICSLSAFFAFLFFSGTALIFLRGHARFASSIHLCPLENRKSQSPSIDNDDDDDVKARWAESSLTSSCCPFAASFLAYPSFPEEKYFSLTDPLACRVNKSCYHNVTNARRHMWHTLLVECCSW